ncbi:MAG: protein kinase [bacterium]
MEALKVLNSRYQLLSVIKRGGFGIIYKGYDSVLGKDIAVKEIKPELLDEARYIDLFQAEARHAAKMSHQNIVHIFDLLQTEDNKFYVVMEYIDGLDLSKLLQECQSKGELIPQHLAVYIVAEVCKALDYAHNCCGLDNNEPLNLVHQDISPSNIMISSNGLVKLIDFGIAGKHKRSLIEKHQMTFQGKFQYMSPEHLGTDLNPDKRSDIFSLGLVLYETLEGKRYFQNEDVHNIMERLKNGKLRIEELKHTPKPLQGVLHKALEKLPERRYQDANQFYSDLANYLGTHSDPSKIDAELEKFISKFTSNKTKTKLTRRKFEIKDSDDFFETVFADILIDDSEEEKPPVPNIPSKEIDIDESDQAEIHEAITSLPQVKKVIPEQNEVQLQNDLEVGDDINTVIDVVRLSTRGHKKRVIQSAIGLTGLIVIFLMMDTAFQWTQIGSTTYDYLFPPAIKISSIPSGAKVFLDNEPLPGATPISVNKIQPGVHQLKLMAAGYAPIVKSIQVPSKGKIYIRGEESRGGHRPYIFRFKTTLELSSEPQNAEVYINNIKYGRNTPCTVTWEVGEPCQIEMRKKGFPNITAFNLDTEQMINEVEDRRFWKMDIVKEPNTRYRITGVFGRFITIKSNPSKAIIYLDNYSTPIGVTGKQDQIFLSAADHEIILKKRGYNTRVLDLRVNESTPSEILVHLSRPVKFFAQDASQSRGRDIGAVIKKIVRNGKDVVRGKRTPSHINLLSFDYYAIFTKEGYQDTKVQISPKDNYVVAKMTPAQANITVVILERVSGDPVGNVEVSYKSLDDPHAAEKTFDITDFEGTCSGSLAPGLYVFRTSKNGYKYQEKSILVQASRVNRIEFNLSKL